MRRRLVLRAATLAAFLAILPAVAQEGPASEPAEPEAENPLARIDWKQGPVVGALGDLAEISIPEGFVFADGEGARKFLEATQNTSSGSELGIVLPVNLEGEEGGWFVIFEFSDVGYVKDDEKDKLDADAILKSLRSGQEEGNKVRKERGWPALEISDWAKPPFYDPKTNNLTWGVLVTSGNGQSINYSTRLLGRRGYVNADLVMAPESLAKVIPNFDTLVAGFSYREGQRYAEYKAGDKVAKYGLTALVVGGAGALAAKTGLLSKMWKIIVGAGIALAAAFRRVIARLFRRTDPSTDPGGGGALQG